VNQPDNYFDLFTDLPENIIIQKDATNSKHLVHYFTKDITELERDITALRQEILPNGMVWISWPKKASKIPTNITEDLIRQLALSNGLVDVKVCAVDEVWSGLKLVVRVKDRVTK
jgi:hypothetical protein